MALDWTNKIDNVDIVLADDINAIAAAVIENENKIKDKAEQVELERLNYYGDKDIVPSDESYFTVNETGETITGLTDTGKTQTELVIPYKINGVEITSIAGCYYSNALTIKIPNSVTNIGHMAFYNDADLKLINIPDNVTTIGNTAFSNCTSLTSINIPDNVTSIGVAAFRGCTNLTIYCEQGSYAETYAKENNIPVMYTDISAIDFNNKADKATTLEGYGIIDAYTKTEVDTKDSALKDDMSDLKQKSIPNTTASGYPLTITDHLEGKTVINYQVYGNSTQATRSGKNILPYPYNDTTKTGNGITFTDNGDGTIILNGTVQNGAGFVICQNVPIDVSKIYFLSGIPSNITNCRLNFFSNDAIYSTTDVGNGALIDLSSYSNIKTFSISLTVSTGDTLSNVVIKPQLEIGSEATSYEQYGVMPSPDYPSEIQSVGDLVTDETSEYYGKYDVPVTVCGKNLFDMETILPEQGWVKQDDGSYYVANNGTVRNKVLWENTENYTGQLKILFQAKYAVDNQRGSYLWVNYTDGTYLVVYYAGTVVANTWYYPESSRTITDSNKIVQNIVWTYGTGATSTWVKDIIITKDLTATEYEPYSGETKHIYLDEPLRKVGDYADYVDFQSQKTIRQVEVLDDTGTTTIDESFGILATPTEESIIAPELGVSTSVITNILADTAISPSIFYLTYYQDINKVITNLTNAILAQGGNV